MGSTDDLSTRARIRDAALARFGADGVRKATLRAIAADAGVSAGLVVHHFGSKDGLLAACDAYLLDVAESKIALLGKDKPAAGALNELLRQAGPLQGYIGAVLRARTPAAQRLFDLLVDATEAYLRQAEAAGEMRPAADPRARAVAMMAWGLGALLCGDWIGASFGSADGYGPEAQLRFNTEVVDIYTHGLFTDDRFQRVTAAMRDAWREEG